ncbi:hypothetical protein [Paenibacillus sp. CF384]|uniref:hypothetical protein n=1 Tax=Paenibacillus sp. CF384 TaxID=1884382 RepID=UPI00089579AD|nr:hypothetical protein SAMN05518855_100585 [Paenibacillus sp. CF384]
MSLFHYYDKRLGPFRNLSSLPMEQAEEVQRQLVREGKGFASRRSADYLTIRRELEAAAREIFIAKGGKPQQLYPHYMTLGACGWIEEWFEEGGLLQIPLDEFEVDSVSFTYGDLFPTMRFNDDRAYRKQVYTRLEIENIIEQYGLPQQWNADGAFGPERYIEVQVWDEHVIGSYK